MAALIPPGLRTLVQIDPYLETPAIRPGIYLDGGTKSLIDVGGNHTAVVDGKICLTDNTVKIYGRGNGAIEWVKVAVDHYATTSDSTGCYNYLTPGTASATVRVKYNSCDMGTTGLPDNDWGPMGYFIADESSTCTDWEWTTGYGTCTQVKVYRYGYDPQSGWIVPDIPSPADRIKKIIAERCAPNFIRDRRALDFAPDIREIRARQTLRRVIGDDKFRNFIKKGFITVFSKKSGKTYQISPGHGLTNVYLRGKMVERLCVVMSGNFPPTDSLIMRYLMILNNEEQFRSLANVSGPSIEFKSLPREPDKRSLVEIFAAFKGRKAA